MQNLSIQTVPLPSPITTISSPPKMDPNSTTQITPTTTSKPSKFREWDLNYLHQQFGFYLALVLYAFYIFLIATKTTKVMRPYKKVLALHCVVDLSFVLTNLILHGEFPCIPTDRGTKCFRFVTAFWVYPSRHVVWLSEMLNKISTGWHVPGVAVTFLYRYLLICRNYEMSLWVFLLVALISVLMPATITGFVDFYRSWPKDEDLYYEKYFTSSEWLYFGRIPTFTVPITPSSTFESTAHIIPSYISYLLIFFTTYRINKTLNSLQNRSQKVKRMQTEMTIVLWIQAALPFFSHIIPYAVAVLSSFISFDRSFLFYFTKTSIWAPAANVILSVFIIGPYRNFIRNSCFFCLKKIDEPSTSNVVSVVTKDMGTRVSHAVHK